MVDKSHYPRNQPTHRKLIPNQQRPGDRTHDVATTDGTQIAGLPGLPAPVPYDWDQDPELARELADPLRAARGIAVGALTGAALWAPIICLIWRWLR